MDVIVSSPYYRGTALRWSRRFELCLKNPTVLYSAVFVCPQGSSFREMRFVFSSLASWDVNISCVHISWGVISSSRVLAPVISCPPSISALSRQLQNGHVLALVFLYPNRPRFALVSFIESRAKEGQDCDHQGIKRNSESTPILVA